MIPVVEPTIGKTEIAYVTDALRLGEISGNVGTYLDRFEKDFAAYCRCKHGCGTTPLHLAVDAAGMGPGDEQRQHEHCHRIGRLTA